MVRVAVSILALQLNLECNPQDLEWTLLCAVSSWFWMSKIHLNPLMAGRNVPQYLELLFREDSLVSSTSSLRGCEKKLITTTTSCPKKNHDCWFWEDLALADIIEYWGIRNYEMETTIIMKSYKKKKRWWSGSVIPFEIQPVIPARLTLLLYVISVMKLNSIYRWTIKLIKH